MPGHLPDLNAKSLARLRKLVSAMQADNGKGLPLANLVALKRELNFKTGLTIDFEATEEIGSPMVVLRVPAERGSRAGLENLTKRENEVADLIAEGLTNADIAGRLCISIATVKDHVHNILEKTGLKTRTRIAAAVLGQAPRSLD